MLEKFMCRSRIALVIILAVIELLPIAGYALKSDSQQTAYLNSNTATYDRTARVQTYTGNVDYTQGTMHLTADNLEIYLDETNKAYKIVATGKQAHYTSMPDNSKFPLLASADTIEYYPHDGIVKLIGNGKVEQNKNKFMGPNIIYSIIKQTVLSDTAKNNKTVIIFRP
jgi:lipopolysaccharide export system protein LptA